MTFCWYGGYSSKSNACFMFVYLKLSWSVLAASAFSLSSLRIWAYNEGQLSYSFISVGFVGVSTGWFGPGYTWLVFVSLIQTISTSGRKSLSKLLRNPSLPRNRWFVGKTTLQVKPALGNYIYLCIYIYVYMYTMECYFQRVIWQRDVLSLYLLESFCITFCTVTGELPPQLSTVIPLDWDSVWTTLKVDGRGSHVAVMFDVIVLAEVSALTEPNLEFGSRLFNFLIGVWPWRLWLGKSILSTYANMLFDLARHWSTTRHFAAAPQAAGVGFGKILHHTWEFSFLASLCHQSVSSWFLKAHGLKVSPKYP